MGEPAIDIVTTAAYIANTVTYSAGLPILTSLRAQIQGETDASSNALNHGGAFKISSSTVTGSTGPNSHNTPFVFVTSKHTKIDASNNATYHMTIASETTDAVTTGFDVMFFKQLDAADSVALLNGFDVSGVHILKQDNDEPTATFAQDASTNTFAINVIRDAINAGNGGTAAHDLCGNTMSAFLAHDLNNQLLKLFGVVSTVGGVDTTTNNHFNTTYDNSGSADVSQLIKDALDLIIEVDASSSSVTLDSSGAANKLDTSGNSWDSSGATQLLREIPYDNLNLYDASNNLTTKSLPLKSGDTIIIVFDTDPSGIHMTPTQSRGISIDGNPNAGDNFRVSYTPAVRRLGLALTVNSGHPADGELTHPAFTVDDTTKRFTQNGGDVAFDPAAPVAAVLGKVVVNS
jgi:hypothetical protein